MKTQSIHITNEFKLFEKAYKDEFVTANKRYEKALKDFEKSMKDFVIKHITGEKGFKKSYEEAFVIVKMSIQDESVNDFVDNKSILEFLIDDHLFCLEEEQDDKELIAT